MTKQELIYLEDFYNQRFRCYGMPEFKNLSSKELARIYNLTTFKGYVLGRSFQELGKAVGQEISNLKHFFVRNLPS